MFIELHILQNFAPSNLNRDETGTPKSCQFGDVPRARVSSQALKRAARDFVRKNELLDPKILGKRSLLIVDKLKQILMNDFGKEESDAAYVAKYVLAKTNWKKDDEKEESEALQFLGSNVIRKIAEMCNENWDLFQESLSLDDEKKELKKKEKSLKSEITSLTKKVAVGGTDEQKSELDGKTNELEEIKPKLAENEELTKEANKKLNKLMADIKKILGAKQTPDIAMFGRMLANAPEFAIDAASQVAHAISTHTVNNAEFDYFTAIDEFKKELKPNSDAGAAMIGSTDFNSACYYRYANIDLNLLRDNLKNAGDSEIDGDSETQSKEMREKLAQKRVNDLAKKTVEAFLTSFVIAVPSGKQNSFASPTLPTFVLGVIREGYLCSLANAFSKPIRLRDEDDFGLVEKSIQQMTKHFFNKERMYGKTVGTKYGTFCSESSDEFVFMPEENKAVTVDLIESDSLEDLIENLTGQIFGSTNGE